MVGLDRVARADGWSGEFEQADRVTAARRARNFMAHLQENRVTHHTSAANHTTA